MATLCEREENGFTFTWRIKNFSFCDKLKDESLDSPKYVVHSFGNTEWFLRLYPRGRIFNCYIPCFLRRSDSNEGTEDIEIDYSLSVISADGSHMLTKEIIGHSFSRGTGFGFPDFMRRDDIFNNKSMYLLKDTLTIRCQMWKKSRYLKTLTLCNAYTRIGVETRCFTWSIKHFTSRNWREKLTVPVMTASKLIPDLNICFFVTASDDYFRVTIEKANDIGRQTFLKCEVSVLDGKGHTRDSKKDEHMFVPDEREWEFLPFIQKGKLTRNVAIYLPDDVLNLRCGFAISSGTESERIEEFIYGSSKSCQHYRAVSSSENISHRFNLRNDIYRLYIKQKFCDLTLRTESVYILVHRVVVCARSPVICNMVEHDPVVRNTGIVDIPDIDSETLKGMLTFMYTDILNEMTAQSAMKLYLLAVAYQVYSLKEECSYAITTNLSLENVCEVLAFSEMHDDGLIKTASQEFVSENAHEIFISDKWKRFMIEWIQLAGETMHQVWLKKL